MLRRVSFLVGVALVLAGGCSTSDEAESSTTPVPTSVAVTTTTTETTIGVDAMQIVQDVVAAWNTSEYDALLDFFAEDGTLDGHPIRDDAVEKNIRFYMVLGINFALEECRAGPAEGGVVCHTVARDDLSGPVGALFDADWVFQIADGKVTSCAFDIRDPSMVTFVTAMAEWVESEYPEVFEATFAAPGLCSPVDEHNCYQLKWYSSPEAAAVLLELGPEFIAQSDQYSIQG